MGGERRAKAARHPRRRRQRPGRSTRAPLRNRRKGCLGHEARVDRRPFEGLRFQNSHRPPGVRFAMLLEQRFPNITSVLPAYFYLEWYEVQGPTLEDQVRSLLESEPAEGLLALNAEI